MVPMGEDAFKDLIETIGKDAPAAYVLEVNIIVKKEREDSLARLM